MMTLSEYKAWLDGMIAATGDERLQAARVKLDEVADAPLIVVPSIWPASPSPSTAPPWWQQPVWCASQTWAGGEVTAWNGVQ